MTQKRPHSSRRAEIALSVKQSSDGTWAAVRDGEIIAAGLSNAAACREADRIHPH
jgi:hypothetical protein